MIIRLKAVRGPIYLNAILERARFKKKLLVQEVELGAEISIPQELSQKSLPLSFRYYDPILAIIQDLISD